MESRHSTVTQVQGKNNIVRFSLLIARSHCFDTHAALRVSCVVSDLLMLVLQGNDRKLFHGATTGNKNKEQRENQLLCVLQVCVALRFVWPDALCKSLAVMTR